LSIFPLPTTRGPQAVQWGLVANTQAMSSPFDRTTQTVESPGARWKASVSWPGLPLADWRHLSAHLAWLGGRAGRFYYGPPQGRRRATATLGTVRVKGAGQTGGYLIIDGLPTSVVVFAAGDWFSYLNAAGRPMLHVIVDTVTSNGSGEAGMYIAPPLRGSPADNVEINHAAPVGVFMMVDDEQATSSHDPTRPNRADISIEIIEALV